MLRKLYDWVMRLAASRHAPVALAIVSFAESSVFPVPPDVMLAPMVAAKPERAYVFAAICTAGSVCGAMLGYAIGALLAPVAQHLLVLTGHPDGAVQFQAWYAQYGLLAILAKGLTPIPFKLVTISAGLAHFDLFTFVWACIVTRGLRFFIEAAILKRYGPAILKMVEKRLALWAAIGIIVLVSGFVAARLLH
jgi:membrane protein YqaA with SNARE-associated domain